MSDAPTDAEILALAQQHLKAFAQFTGAGEVWFEGEVEFARAALAKWGTQPQAGAVPQGWKAVPVNPTPEMWMAAKSVPDPNPPYPPHYGLVWDAMLAASPTPPAGHQAAPKAAPGVGNSGFDHQTAADFLSGKTVSDEAVRKFVHASRLAHDEKAALSAMLLSARGELASREAEIALLKKELMEAESAPQPAPLSDDVVRDAALWHWLAEYLVGTRTDLDDEIVASKTVNDLRKLAEAAIAAQGGRA